MRLVAGVDVGNTTTEVVLVDAGSSDPLAWDRAPTRGRKGSWDAWLAAASLVRRLERRCERTVDLVAAAPQHPVDTRVVSLDETIPALGRLKVIATSGLTPGRVGFAVGAPRWAHHSPQPSGTGVVLLVRRGTGFRRAVDACRAWSSSGVDVRGVLMADDEGVLLAARLGGIGPVLDQVNVEAAAEAERVAVEVRDPGHPLHFLVDPIRLADRLGLAMTERADAVALADVLGDVSCAVVAVHTHPVTKPGSRTGELMLRGGGRPVPFDVAFMAKSAVGAVAGYLPPGCSRAVQHIEDLWAVGLREVASSVAARMDPTTARAVVLAALRHDPDSTVATEESLSGMLDVAVRMVPSEAEAARTGAMSTPGAGTDSVVVDLGGGTLDVLGPDGQQIVAAGGGELLTEAVGTYLHIPRGAADWVKRGPSARVEAPQLLLAEDGVRSFLDRPTSSAVVGLLVTPGPAGLLPFSRTLAPAEWRALRLRLKRRALVDNLVRAIAALESVVREVVLVGGVAGDEELLGVMRPVFAGLPVGIGNVAGRLGHRYAAAYGMAVRALEADR